MSLIDQLSRNLELAKLGLQITQSRSEAQLSESVLTTMASLHGLPQKFAQILSIKNLNSDSNPYLELTESPNKASYEQYMQWLLAALGSKRIESFASISTEGTSASIGQVHSAILQSGEKVAVKVQYPGIASTIQSDLSTIGWLSLPLAGTAHKYSLNSYREELRRSLLLETDYSKELDTLLRFRTYLKPFEDIVSPKPVQELSTDKVLTMSWIEGVSFEEARKWSTQDRTQIATLLLTFYLSSWLVWGEGHADPHCGNYRLRKLPGGIQLGVLDFGCTLRISQSERQALYNLLQPDVSLDKESALEVYTALGFSKELLEPLSKDLPKVTQIFRMPFVSKDSFDVRTWKLSERISEVLGEQRWNFRYAGPAQMIGFIRSTAGLLQYMTGLGVDVSWSDALTRITSEPILNTSRHTPERAHHTKIIETQEELSPSATLLKILVTENNKTKVQLTLPASSAYELYELVPEDVARSILKQGTDLDEIVTGIKKEGLHKRVLFQTSIAEKRIRIELL